MVEMKPVESSQVKAVGYDPAASELFIEFTRGAVYVYRGVPRDVYDRFLAAESKGRFFSQEIKGKFEHTKEDNGGASA